MAYAINVKTIIPVDAGVAWPVHQQFADKTADISNPGVDHGFAAFWAVAVKVSIKVLVGTFDARIFFTDANDGATNPREIARCSQVTAAVLGTRFLSGWTDKAQQYGNFDVTLGTSGTFDVDWFAAPAG